MALERKNDLGTIKLDDYVFAQIVRAGFSKCQGKAFHASEKGKLLGNQGVATSVGDISSNIKISETEDRYELEIYTIIRFGESIRQTSKEILDYIEYEMKGLFPEKGGKITLKIVGIMSIKFKRIVPRDIKVIRRYEPQR